MIPQFPTFKQLEITDKHAIERITSEFPPYAEFNFARMWIWNAVARTEISLLCNNLIIKSSFLQSKYTSFSFVGTDAVDASITTLIRYAEKFGIDTTLQSTPEFVLNHLEHPENFIIAEDRDKFEYILSTDEVLALEGSKFRAVRQKISRFIRDYTDRIAFSPLPLTDVSSQSILDLYATWRKRGKTLKETAGGLKTLQRAITFAEALQLLVFGLYLDGTLVGYAFVERSFGNCLMRQISVADASYRGATQYLAQRVIAYAQTQECKYINIMEDDGIPGLRESKEQWRPTHFLKKYRVQLKIRDINS